MDIPAPARCLLRFGVFELDLRAGELRKSGAKVRIQQQPLQLLGILIQRAGEVVTRQELRDQLWPDGTYVDFDRSLNKAVVKLREALGDSAESPRFIETLPKVGYRFIATSTEEPQLPLAPPPVRHQDLSRPPSFRPRTRIAVVCILVLVAIAGACWLLDLGSLRERIARRGSSTPIRSIAVLPLQNLSGDPEQEYFADGMTDELISDLAQISALRVISRTSVMQYKNAKKPLREIGRELNVDAVVEGTVERSGGRVRISAQLIKAPSDTHLWAKTYERDLGNVLALQDEVAGAIADEIRITLLPSERQRLTAARPVNPEAHEAYLRGLYHIHKRTQSDLEKSTAYYQRAIELDPDYALAYAGLAESYALRGSLLYMVLPPQDVMPKSQAAALKALQLDNSLGEAWATLGYVETLYGWNWPKGEEYFRRAIELDPNYAQAHLWYAMYLAAVGRHPESITEIKRAQELDPLSLIINSSVGLMYYFAHQYDTAIDQFRQAIELDPDFYVAHWELGMAYQQKQMYPQARAEFQKAQQLSPGNSTIMESIAEIDALTGHKNEAQRTLDHLIQLSKTEFVSPYVIAELSLVLGNRDEALEWMEKACQQRDNNLIYFNCDPSLAPIRSDPRFRDLASRIGLPKQ